MIHNNTTKVIRSWLIFYEIVVRLYTHMHSLTPLANVSWSAFLECFLLVMYIHK